mmetsp:Transcript_1351/g.2962  ORF Transcript_1351/g.2962 Transcript_1351/m.2962 type:complete len:89 (-) Transcript_1351:2484-2750(-)
MLTLARVALLGLWAAAHLSGNAAAFSASVGAPARQASATSSVFTQLETTPLVRASDEQAVALPTLWRSETPFGLGDEVAVCAFLRHFG